MQKFLYVTMFPEVCKLGNIIGNIMFPQQCFLVCPVVWRWECKIFYSFGHAEINPCTRGNNVIVFRVLAGKPKFLSYLNWEESVKRTLYWLANTLVLLSMDKYSVFEIPTGASFAKWLSRLSFTSEVAGSILSRAKLSKINKKTNLAKKV